MSERVSEDPLDVDRGRACLLITGAPGAGKSTVSRLLAERLTRSAYVDAYFVSTLVVSGYVWPLGEPAEEAARQVRLLYTNLCALARNFVDAGFTPVLDLVVPDAEDLEVFRRALGSCRLLLVVLDPGADACRQRNEDRPPEAQFFFDGYDELRASMRTGFGDLGWWFDTSTLTAEQTADRILREAPGRALVSEQAEGLLGRKRPSEPRVESSGGAAERDGWTWTGPLRQGRPRLARRDKGSAAPFAETARPNRTLRHGEGRGPGPS